MSTIAKSPDASIRCLLVQPRFSAFSFWNFRDACNLVGAKTPAPPLGLLTIAAILPQNWEFKLMDLNCDEFDEELWQWAELVCVGGMLPQQAGILEIIKRANRDGKFVAVGGPDPTSQPDTYKNADVRVMGEGEITIPMWLDSWRQGSPSGKFESDKKPDVTKTPIPRFDLIKFDDYLQIGVQYSRGCPFNCEFCDIIELYGRVPRTKTSEQIISELQRIYDLGYRGAVDMVDDNFIGNKRSVKKMLPDLIAWQKERRYPFFFSTEASMNLGDDKKLMEMMEEAEFRFVFMGIESPDPETLMATQKSQNTMHPIVKRVQNIYDHGMVVLAGFILGFDNEKPGAGQSIIQCIEETGICMSMVGLLVALPNTQLTRRLNKEGRLLSFQGKLLNAGENTAAAAVAADSMTIVDQTVCGLNFVTTRDRVEVFREFQDVVKTVFSPRRYLNRAYKTAKRMTMKPHRIPRIHELRRYLRGMVRRSIQMSAKPVARWLYWKNIIKGIFLGPQRFEVMMRLMAMYLHYDKQTRYLLSSIDEQIVFSTQDKDVPRKLTKTPEPSLQQEIKVG